MCFDAAAATGGTSTTGYPAQCYNGAAWDGSAADSGSATAITITAGVTKTGVNATLAAGGAISGRVTDSSSDGLSNVVVDVDSTASGGYEATATTAANGDYTVTGLPAGTQTVCFNAGQATGGSSTGGYVDQCYHDVSWNGYENEVLAGATAVTVTASATTSGINATLASSAAITGTVTDTSSDPISDVEVEVLTSSGGSVGYSFTGSDGTYSVTGLSSGTYDVCFSPTYATGGASATGYQNQCYNDVSWMGTSRISAGRPPCCYRRVDQERDQRRARSCTNGSGLRDSDGFDIRSPHERGRRSTYQWRCLRSPPPSRHRTALTRSLGSPLVRTMCASRANTPPAARRRPDT